MGANYWDSQRSGRPKTLSALDYDDRGIIGDAERGDALISGY